MLCESIDNDQNHNRSYKESPATHENLTAQLLVDGSFAGRRLTLKCPACAKPLQFNPNQ